MTKQYSEIKDQIKPLDLLLFRGNDFISDTIKEFEWLLEGCGEFSHAGLVVDNKILPFVSQLKDDHLYVWESTMSGSCDGYNKSGGVPDIEIGKGRFGVQIRDLEDVIISYEETNKSNVNENKNTAVAWCQLIKNPFLTNDDNRKEIIDELNRFHTQYGFRKYELNPLVLLSAIFGCCRKLRNDYDKMSIMGHNILVKFGKAYGKEDDEDIDEESVFCSQFVTMIYKRLNIIPKNIRSSDISPVDFLLARKIEKLVADPVYIIPDK